MKRRETKMETVELGFSATDALLYLCASRCGRGWLSRTLVGVTALVGAAVGIIQLLMG
jgi:hypothetical protein